MTARGFAYLTHWFWSAVELETRLGGGVETTSRLAALRKGGEVRFEVDRVEPLRLGFWSKTSQRVAAYAIIAVFSVAYLGFAVLGIVLRDWCA